MTDYVYRAYDANGFLLYVGMTSSIGRRMAGHKNKSRWFPGVKMISYTIYETRAEAAQAERDAIRDEAPLYNLAQHEATGNIRMSDLLDHNKELWNDLLRRQVEVRAKEKGEENY